MGLYATIRVGGLIPGAFAEEDSHAAGIGDAGKDEAGTDKSGQYQEVGGQRCAEKGADDDEAACGNAYLPFEGYGLSTTDDREVLIAPRLSTAFDDDEIRAAGQFCAGGFRARAGLADDIDGFAG